MYIKENGIWLAYISKINLNSGKQIIILMIPNVEEKVALSFSKYLKGKSSKHEGDFYCMKCL